MFKSPKNVLQGVIQLTVNFKELIVNVVSILKNSKNSPTMLKRPIKTLILHCSDTPDNRDVDIEEVRFWHINDNKWDDVGYHYFIKRDGTVQQGRKEETIGAHCRGQNSRSIGICLAGNKRYSEYQVMSLKKLLVRLMKTYKLTHEDIKGHYEFDIAKTCPNINMKEFREAFKNHERLALS